VGHTHLTAAEEPGVKVPDKCNPVSATNVQKKLKKMLYKLKTKFLGESIDFTWTKKLICTFLIMREVTILHRKTCIICCTMVYINNISLLSTCKCCTELNDGCVKKKKKKKAKETTEHTTSLKETNIAHVCVYV
jgi:hypothetical protein